MIGVGNEYRSDDSSGLIVVRQLRQQLPSDIEMLEQSGEGMALMESWTKYEHVFLVDAVVSDKKPGTIHRFDAGSRPLPAEFFNYSTHAFGVAEAVEMARQLGQLPPTLIVFGIEGRTFSFGLELSLEVKEATELVAQQLIQEVEELNISTGPTPRLL